MRGKGKMFRSVGRLCRDHRGFTLVEMIVAVFLFSVVATGLATLMGVLIQNNTFSQDMTEATTLAENKMEVFKNTAYSKLTAGWNYDMPQKNFWRIWQIQDNTPEAGLKQITVMVIWFDRKQIFHHVSLLTLKSA